MPGQGVVLSISGRTRLAAVIGDPAEHSLSPVIHNAAFDALGLDWLFVALPVRAGNGAAAVDAMRTLDIRGLSVTMPHKADVLSSVDRITDAAQALGAANCIAWSDAGLVAHNTDGAGLVASLREDSGVDVAGLACVVLGAGGAARAVVRALARSGASDVGIVNRTTSRADAAARLAPGIARVCEVGAVADAALIVNATSVGMGAGVDDPDALVVPPDLFGSGQHVVDLVYRPVRTALLAAAERSGAHAIDGVGMLVHQAAIAFGHWTGEAPPVTAMTAAARAAVPVD